VKEPEPVTFPNLRGFSGPTVNSRRKLHLSLSQSQLHFGGDESSPFLIVKELALCGGLRRAYGKIMYYWFMNIKYQKYNIGVCFLDFGSSS